MFTGIIQEIGKVQSINPSAAAREFFIQAPLCGKALKIGDSVACNGVCLTTTEVTPQGFFATAVSETLAKTNLGHWKTGSSVNLEQAVTPQTPLGGHYVMGHIDGVVKVLRWKELGSKDGKGGRELTVQIPQEFAKYTVAKGSFALNGVSLTIASIEGDQLTFALIPHTLDQTNLGLAKVGDTLNFEVDILGKYVEKLLSSQNEKNPLQKSQIEKWGYGA